MDWKRVEYLAVICSIVGLLVLWALPTEAKPVKEQIVKENQKQLETIEGTVKNIWQSKKSGYWIQIQTAQQEAEIWTKERKQLQKGDQIQVKGNRIQDNAGKLKLIASQVITQKKAKEAT
ncbi:hypothetical protein HZB00_04150 [Candidatus Woesearchaeota archaeon]|nr:hypothetical protein [Candidatus Woesearchaeota archaeon]